MANGAMTMDSACNSSTNLRLRSYAALLTGARETQPGVAYDQRGYVCQWQENILKGIPVDEITNDFGSGAGRELDRKLCAAHSSAALVVNTFGPWRAEPESLRIGGVSGFRSIRFEMTFPTGLGGTPPHLDLFADGDSVIAVESKCTEWMDCKPAFFSSSYDRLGSSLGNSEWFDVMRELRGNPDRYKFLDAAQLVKHAFGLLKGFGSRDIRLVYLYWEPANGDQWEDCRRHRQEASALAERVGNSSIRLIPISYQELWAEWEASGPPAHLSFLKSRYSRTV